MRRLLPVPFALAALAALAAGSVPDARVPANGVGTGDISFAGEEDRVAVDLVAGMKLTFTAKPVKKGPVRCTGTVLDPREDEVAFDPKLRKEKNGAVTVRSVPATETGTWFVAVRGTDAGPLGEYVLTTKATAAPKPPKATGTVTAGGSAEIAVDALAGSLLTVTVKASKGSTLRPRVTAVLGPGDVEADLGATGVRVRETANSASVSKLPLPAFGTWRVILGGDGTGGGYTATLAVTPLKASKTVVDFRGASGGEAAAGAPESVEILGVPADVGVGATAQLLARGTWPGGRQRDLTRGVTWATRSRGAATVSNGSAPGALAGVAAGGTTVQAWTGTVEAREALVLVGGAALASIDVLPAGATLAAGESAQLQALGTLTGAGAGLDTADLTRAADWSHQGAALSASTGGLAVAAAAGAAQVTAEVGDVASAAADVTVAGKRLVRLDVSPAYADVTGAQPSRTITVTGTWSDGTTSNVTAQCALASDNLAAVTVAGTTATRVANGTAGIRATLDGVTSRPAVLNSGPVAVSSVVVTGTTTVARGATTDLAATATFADGGTRDVTEACTWATADANVVTVSTTAGSRGRVTGAGNSGSANVTATLSRSGALAVSAAPAQVASIRVVPAATAVAAGEAIPLRAIASWTDGTTTDVTATAAWGTTNAAAVTASAGTATGVAEGGAVVTATAGGKVGRAVVLTGAARVTGVALSSGSAQAALGESAALTAAAEFSPASPGTHTLGSLAAAFSSDPLAAPFDGAAAAARRTGTADLSAAFAGLVAPSSAFTAQAAAARALTAFPQSAYVSLVADTQLAAQRRRSDGFVTDEAASATWTSFSTQFVTVSGTGLAHAVAKGTSTVRCALSADGLESDCTVAVSGDLPVISNVAPTTVLRGATGTTFTVTGTALDGLSPEVLLSGAGITITSGPTPNGTGTQATFTADVAANAPTGTRDVSYRTIVGTDTLTSAFQVIVPAPTIASISPSNVSIPGAGSTQTSLTVTGTGFESGDTFTIDSVAGASLGTVTVVNSTTMTATLTVQSSASIARYPVTARQSAANGGATATISGAFKLGPPDPTVTAVSPSLFVPEGRTVATAATITGTNFGATIGVSFQNLPSGASVSNVTRVSSTSITFTMTTMSGASFGAVDVVLQNAGDVAVTFDDALVVGPRDPTITSFSAHAFARGVSAVPVTVKGTNFRSGATLVASGAGVSFSSTTLVDAETLTATATVASDAAAGARDLVVSHPSSAGGRGATLASAFTVTSAAPSVTSLNPGTVGRTCALGPTRRVPVTITGTGFSEGATVAVARSGGTGVSVATGTTTVVSDTRVVCELSVTGAATAGAWNVTVTNPTGGGNSGTSGNNALTIVSESTLAVNRVTPGTGSAAGGERVTVEGSGFSRGCRVEFGSEKAWQVQYIDASTLVCTVPPPAAPASSSATTVSTTDATPVDVKVTLLPAATNATLTSGFSYAADDGVFTVASIIPAEASSTAASNLKTSVMRLSQPANTATAVFGTTAGTHCRWFEVSWYLYPTATVGFGADRRFLGFSRTGGTLPVNGTGEYVMEIPTAVKSDSGRALTPANLASTGTRDQWSFFLSGTADNGAPTISSSVPTSGATGVGTTTTASVTFSEAVDPITITTSSVQLKQGSTVLSAAITLSDDLRTVTLTPTEELARNTTYTISLTSTVADLCGNTLAAATRTFTTAASDLVAPVFDSVTIADLPSSLDGSGTYVDSNGTGGNAFDAYMPTSGWTVVVRFSDAGDGVDPSTFGVQANTTVGSASANTPLASKFTVTGTGATWTIGSSDAFAAQDNVTLTFNVSDRAGNAATAHVLTFDTVGIDTSAVGGAGSSGGDHDPLDARETWVLRFDRDVYTATLSTAGLAPPDATQQCTTTGSSNGTPDMEEALRLCGLQSTSMTTEAAATVNGTSVGTNAIVLRMFQERVRATLRARFGVSEDGSRGADAMNIEFLLPGEQGSLSSIPAWSSTDSSASANAYNEMDIGGDTQTNSSQTGTYGTIGQAWYDPRNLNREANLNAGSAFVSNNNGIFCINMFKSVANVSRTGTAWGVTVTSQFLAAKGGTPVGQGTLDDDVLAGTFDRSSNSNTQAQNDRYDAIMDAVEFAAMSVSGVTAHEIGHSLGLVPNGAPKTGLFGNAHYNNAFTEATSGSQNTSHHLNYLGNDIMSPGSSVDDRAATGTDFMRFSPMDRNYLLSRQVQDEGR